MSVCPHCSKGYFYSLHARRKGNIFLPICCKKAFEEVAKKVF